MDVQSLWLAADRDHVLCHSHDLWSDMDCCRVFLTGGTGFFGCWLLDSFLWANDLLGLRAEVVVLTRSPHAFHRKAPHLAGHPAVRLLSGEVREFDHPEGPFSYIIHAATESNAALNDLDPLRMLDTIVGGTRAVLEFAKARQVRRVLFVSSGAVYGRQPAELSHIPEVYSGAPDPLDPRSAYGEGKRQAELLCTLYARDFGLEPVIARCFAFVGPYLPLDVHFAVGNFIRDALRGGPIRVNGDGTAYRSYLYAADLAVWLWTLLLRGEACRAYNVGSDRALSIAEIARSVAACLPGNCEVQIAPESVPGRPAERYVPSIARARRELGLEALISFEEALRRSLAWHRTRKGQLLVAG